MLMGEDDAKVSLVAGSEGEEELEVRDEHGDECDHEGEYEWEYEDGGLWVGTMSAAEVLEWGREAPVATDALTPALSDGRSEEREASELNEEGSDFQVDGEPEKEAAGDGWWDLGAESPDHEDAGVSTVQIEPFCCLPRKMPRPGHPTAAGGQWTRKKQEAAADQQWEEARQYARLRQMSNSSLNSEDENEGQLGGWKLESYKPP